MSANASRWHKTPNRLPMNDQRWLELKFEESVEIMLAILFGGILVAMILFALSPFFAGYKVWKWVRSLTSKTHSSEVGPASAVQREPRPTG